MELFIIRHAESANNAKPVEERVEDPPITELGIRQAERLADRLRHIQPTRIFVSPFRRTLETLAPYLLMTDVVPEAWIDLHEQGGAVRGHTLESYEGRPGMSRQAILTEFPDMILADEIDHEGWWKCKPFESVEEAVVRAERVARQVRDDFAHTNERVALITHGMFMSLFTTVLLGLPYEGYDRLEDIANTSFTKFTITIPHTRIGLLNCVRHLPEEWITGVDVRHLRTRIPV